jgi:uncharacterized protein
MTTSRRGLLGLFSLAAAGAGAKAASAAPQGLDMEKLKKDADVACLYHADFGDPARFSQVATVAELQGKGFAYLKVG